MGLGGSTSRESHYRETIARITGPDALPFDEPLWESLFGESVVELASGSAAERQKQVAGAFREMQQFGRRLVSNNLSSGNLQRLVLHTCIALLDCSALLGKPRPAMSTSTSSGAAASEEERLMAECRACMTAVSICRAFLQYFVENVRQDMLALHLSGWPDELPASMFELPEVGRGVPRALMKSLVSFLVSVRVSDIAYECYEEALTLLIVLCSAPMFGETGREPSLFFDMLMTEAEYFDAANFTAKLLQNIERRRTRKLRVTQAKNEVSTSGGRNGSGSGGDGAILVSPSSSSSSTSSGEEQRGILWRIAGYGSAVFLLPFRALEWLLQGGTDPGAPVIANYSALMLLLFANYRKPSGFVDAFTGMHDPQSPIAAGETLSPLAFETSFATLLEALGARMNHDPHVLMLYFLLHRNVHFRQYVQSRADLDTLLVPLLRHLYTVSGMQTINPQQLYIILITLLIFTQLDEFGTVCARLRLADCTWYKEHTLLDLSLADLIAIVVVRTVTLNLSRLQDGYLHTNCVAILANLSPAFSNLHVHAAQRLFSLLFFLQKRYSHTVAVIESKAFVGKQQQQQQLLAQQQQTPRKGDSGSDLVNQNNDNNNNNSGSNSNNNSAAVTAAAVQTPDEQDNELAGSLALYEQLMTITMEVMQSIVSMPLTRNASFVYALLHSRDSVVLLGSNEKWKALMEPLLKLLHHFDPIISVSSEPKTIEEVYVAIERGIMSWPAGQNAKSILKFAYKEEDDAESFFTPYVFSLVFQHAGTPFNARKITLFFLPEMASESYTSFFDEEPAPLGLVIQP